MNYVYLQSVFISSVTPFCTEQGAKRLGMIYYSILLLSSFVSAVLVYVYMERRRNILKQKLSEKEAIEKEFIRKREVFQKTLIERFEISKQILVMNSMPIPDIKEKKVLNKINELFCGEADIDYSEKFYLLFNELYDDFETKIIQFFPCLNEQEVRICCLLRAGFDTSNISFILEYVPITVRLKKTIIRKKIGMTDGGDVAAYLSKIVEE
jgi:hypothetical protein